MTHANHQGEPGDTGMGDDVLARLASLRCHQTCDAAREQDGGKRPCLDCPDADFRPYAKARRDLAASAPTPPDRVGEEVGRECCVPDAGEPSFVLLGRDPQAPGLVELWAHERSRLEPNSPKPAMACEIADRMRAYKLANPDRGLQVASTGSEEETKGADWLDQPIPEDLAFDGTRFGKGVPLRTVIKAAQRWRRVAVAAVSEKVEARKSDGGARIFAGLDDALAWAKGDTSRGKLVTIKDGQIVDVADPAPTARDHVVSARLIPWETDSLGGVDLTFESGLRVALPLSEPEATPKSSPDQTPVDPQTDRDAINFALTIDDHYDRLEFLQSWIKGDLSEWPEFAPSDAPSTTESDR